MTVENRDSRDEEMKAAMEHVAKYCNVSGWHMTHNDRWLLALHVDQAMEAARRAATEAAAACAEYHGQDLAALRIRELIARQEG